LYHADGISTHERNIDGFMDDASLIITVPVMEQDIQPPQYSVEGLTLLAKTAERALFVSGGELKLSKCFSYLLQWLWDSKNRPYMASSDEFPGILYITQGTDTYSPIIIQRLEPYESHRTIGIHLNSMGTHETQLLELLEKPDTSQQQPHTRALNELTHTLCTRFSVRQRSIIHSQSV
jgi:hypothetical protein